MKKGILKNIVYKSAGEFEIYLENNNGDGINYFVNKIDGISVTDEKIESLKGKEIQFDIHMENYTNLKSSININTK